jgi:DNA-binding MarR family transcriptional regulator
MAPAAARRFTDAERDAWSGFLAVHARVTRELDALLGAEHGMPLVEFEVLLKLSIAGGRMRMSELAEVAFLSRSGLTRIVDELEALGLVSREPDERDGRVLVATLTPLGRRRFAAARRTHLANVRELFFRYLTAEQQSVLAVCWEQILDGPEGDLRAKPRRRRRSGGASSARPARPGSGSAPARSR